MKLIQRKLISLSQTWFIHKNQLKVRNLLNFIQIFQTFKNSSNCSKTLQKQRKTIQNLQFAYYNFRKKQIPLYISTFSLLCFAICFLVTSLSQPHMSIANDKTIFVSHFPVSSAADRKSFDEKILMLVVTFSLSVVFKTIINKGLEFKDIIKLWVGPKLIVFLADPRDIELVLSSQVYLDKSPEYRFFKPWLGNGLLISSGEVKNSTSFLVAY